MTRKYWRDLAAPTLAALGIVAGISLAHPLDSDLWIHLNTGRYIAENGRTPVPDPFTFGAAGEDWIPHEWLSEWLIYQLISNVGVWGAQAFFALVSMATWLVVDRALAGARVGPFARAFAITIAALAASQFVGIRPMQFGLLLLAITAAVAMRHRRSGSRLIWLLPPVFLAWANFHGSFPIGFGMLALLGLDWLWRRFNLPSPLYGCRTRIVHLAPVALFGAALVAINPSGPALWAHPFWQLTTPAREFNSDWNPPATFTATWWFFGIFLIGVVVVLIWGRFQIPSASAAAVIVLLALAYSARKTIPFSVLAVVVLLSGSLARIPAMNLRLHSVPGLLLAASMMVPIGVGAWLAPTSLDGPSVVPMPYGARDYIAGLPTGRVWNTYHWGGFLTWTLWPDSKVYIDGRYDPFVSGALESYIHVDGLSPGWEEVLRSAEPDTIIVQFQSALAPALRSDPNWVVTYEDEVATVFVDAGGG